MELRVLSRQREIVIGTATTFAESRSAFSPRTDYEYRRQHSAVLNA